jgi:hypothetical protein
MTQIQDFKDNAFQSVWDHAKQIFKPMLVISLLSTAMFYLIAFVSSEMFFPGFLQEYMNIVTNQGGSLSEQQAQMQELILSVGDIANREIIIVTIALVFMVIFSWIMNWRLLVSQDSVLEREESVLDAFKRSFNRNVFKLILAYLLVTLIIMVVSLLVGLLLSLISNVFFAFIGMFFIFIVAIRFMIGFPGAIVHGDMSVFEAVRFSVKNITTVRSLKIIGIFIGGGILVVIASMLLGLVLMALGTIGTILNLVISFFIGVFITALMTSILSGSFFRYADVEIADGMSEPQDHLIE